MMQKDASQVYMSPSTSLSIHFIRMKILIQRDSYDKFLLVKPKTLILYLRNKPFLTFVGEGLYVLKVILLKEINDEVLIL